VRRQKAQRKGKSHHRHSIRESSRLGKCILACSCNNGAEAKDGELCGGKQFFEQVRKFSAGLGELFAKGVERVWLAGFPGDAAFALGFVFTFCFCKNF
jgi:hypothetical protein